MPRGPCTYCHIQPIVGRLRKYCPEHSRQASAIWKRNFRASERAAGHPYHWDLWKSAEARKAYFRAYMRVWRKRRREGSVEAEAPLSSLDVCLTCRGVLKLQARLTRIDRAAADHQEKTERLLTEARWFVLALEKVQPCAGHSGVTRLARLLAETLARRSPMDEAR